MKKAYSLELLIIILSASGGILSWETNSLFLGWMLPIALFSIASTFVTKLKRETIKEYVKLQKEVQK